jgi:glycosyltransferase involved in cell wall biosynthesis
MHSTSSTDILKTMRLTKQPPIRILHVVGEMVRAGTETWLMNILRHIDRDRFQMDFLVHTTQPSPYEDEIRALGSKIIPCLNLSRPWIYASNFRRIIREYGPYDIVHSHVHHFSGYVLRLAQEAGVPVRIAHSHTSELDSQAKLLRRGYLKLMKHWIPRHGTFGLATSRAAAASMFGSSWDADPYKQILHCGVDLARFHDVIDPLAVRAELNIPPDAFVVGHVGRFEQAKNHNLIVDIAAQIAKREPKMRLLLVGDGSLRSDIEQKVTTVGLSDRVIFTGVRSDVPRLMLGAMDVFLFPSLYEGLGLVLVEAQAAGLPCIFSDVVPEEADLVKPLVGRMSLSQPAFAWAEAILATSKAGSAITQAEALKLVEQSPFNIQTSAKELEKLYVEQYQKLCKKKSHSIALSKL